MSYRISAAIDGELITRLSRVAGVRTARGADSSNVRFSSEDQVSSTLNSGGRAFAKAFSNLNQAGNFVAVSIETLKTLDGIVGNVISLAKKASRSGLGGAERGNISAEYRRLGGQFKRVVEAAAAAGATDPLSETDIQSVLINVGLDRERSLELASMFKKLSVDEGGDSLASDAVRDPRPIQPLPEDAGGVGTAGNVQRYGQVFETGRTIKSRDDARVLVADATVLQTNLRKNIATLEQVNQNVIDNMELVRSTALAMFDGSRDPEILSLRDAQSVADGVRGGVLAKGNSAYLAQAGNLDSILAASLVSSSSN